MHSPSGYEHGKGLEESYLEELIADFGEDDAPEAGEALRRIAERYSQLETGLPAIGDSIAQRVAEGASLRHLLRERVTRLHGALYDGILTNAGTYRSVTDSKRGSVFFGGQQGQKRRPRYSGAPPSKIEEALDDAFAYLSETLEEDEAPTESAVLFYADFVYAHPFYDANGRIGRFLVSLYLYICGCSVEWTRLDAKKNKFIHKLNACHDRRGSKNKKKYRGYQQYLSNFFRDFVIAHADFYHPEVDGEGEIE